MNKSLLKFIASLLLFGSNGLIASMISLSSSEIVMFRTCIGSILLVALYLLSGRRFTFSEHKRSFVFMVLSGCSMGISWLFLYEAYRQIGVSLASLGYYCGPIIVMAASPILFKEKLTMKKLACFFIVFVGIVLVSGTIHGESYSGFGVFCALMSAVMYACMLICNRAAKEITGMENSVIQLTTAFLSVFVFVIIKQGFHFDILPGDIAPLLFLGIFNTGIGCFLYFSSIGGIEIQTVAILGYLEPLSAVLFSFVFLHEVLNPAQIIGAVFIIGGAILAEIHIPRNQNPSAV